jgi:UDP-N-acetylglucosamine 1-carboxyvinyltransferase
MLGRFKTAKVAFPGGCEIGARPIDIHIKGFEALNVKIVDKHGYLFCDGSNMKGGKVHFDFPSVGATENIMLASVLIKGKTEIFNAAKEPEICDLQNFLNKMGANITGAGTSNIVIYGVKKLKAVEYTPITDRIIAGTYLLAALMCGGSVKLKNLNSENLGFLLSKIKNSSCKIICKNDSLYIESNGVVPNIPKIETSPYPGFPTDLQAQFMASQCISKGTSIIVENFFESRFKQVPELIKMGAKIIVKDRTAVVYGVKSLSGAKLALLTSGRRGISFGRIMC